MRGQMLLILAWKKPGKISLKTIQTKKIGQNK
jgi:hypothetical protein